MLKKEWQQVRKNRWMGLAMLVTILVPFVYSFSFLTSAWNPYGNTGKIPVAVVNLDHPAELNGTKIQAGADTIAQLHDDKQLKWEFVSAAQAAKGLANNRYYTVVTIPADFSKNAATVLDDQPKQMKLQYKTNGSLNYVAEIISQVGADKLVAQIKSKVTEAFVSELFGKINTIGSQLKVAADGAHQLDDGSQTLKNGLGQYTAGVSKVNGGLTQLHDQIPALSSGVGQLSDGGTKLAAGLDQLNGKVPALTSGVGQLANGGQQLSSGLDQLNGKVPSLVSGVDQLASGGMQLKDGLGQLNGKVPALTDGISQLNAGGGQLKDGLGQLNGKVPTLVDGVTKLNDGGLQLKDGLGQLNGKVPTLVDGVTKLNDGGLQLKDGLSQLNGKVPTLVDGVTQLDEGANKLYAAVAPNDSDDEPTLATGVEQLKDGIDALADLTLKGRNGNPNMPEGVALMKKKIDKLFGIVETQFKLLTSVSSMVVPETPDKDGVNALKELAKDNQAAMAAFDALYKNSNSLSLANTLIIDRVKTQLNAPGQYDTEGDPKGLIQAIGEFDDKLGDLNKELNNETESGHPTYTAAVTQLQEGLDKLNTAVNLGEGNNPSLVNAVGQLKDGIKQLKDATPALADGVSQLVDGADQLSGGLGQLNDQTPALADGVSVLYQGSDKLADGLGQLNDQTPALADGVSVLYEGSGKLADGLGELHAQAPTLANGVSALYAGSDKLAGGLTTLKGQTPALASGIGQLHDGAHRLDDGLTQLHGQVPALASGVGQLDSGAHQLDDGLTTLNGKVPTLADGVTQLHDGTSQLVANNNQLSDGTAKLQDGAGRLADGLGDGYQQVVATKLTKLTAKMFADPTTVTQSRYSTVKNYGAALAPFVLALALFVAVILFNFVYPMKREADDDRSFGQWLLAKITVGAAAATAMALVEASLLLLVGLPVDHIAGFYGVTLLFALAAMMMTQAFSLVFNRAGLFIALGLLTLSGSGGLFPAETISPLYEAVQRFLPMTYAINAYRQMITSGIANATTTNSIIVLVGIMLVSVAVMVAFGAIKPKPVTE